MAPTPTSTKVLNENNSTHFAEGWPERKGSGAQESKKDLQTSKNTTKASSSSGKGSNGKISPLELDVAENSFDKDDIVNKDQPLEIVWRNVILFIYLHLAAFYGGYLWLSGQVMWQTFLWGFAFYIMTGFGITAGAHRYWAHKSYKANTALRLLLVFMQTASFQNDIFEWSRDHRVHHKYTETNADPHNVNRGFFFAHMGWLMCKKHPSVKVKGQNIDMSDLEQDKLVMFQKKYYLPLVLVCCFLVPTFVPWLFWGERISIAWFFASMFRYCATLHCTWLVNSAAHLWGPKPYDRNINPAENLSVAWWAFGEGWHNYHHVFPWDYKTAEVGIYKYNFSAAFIDFFAKIGWAYDLKSVPQKIVFQRVLRTGDGSHALHNKLENDFKPGPWGWGDKDIPRSDYEVTETLYPVKQE